MSPAPAEEELGPEEVDKPMVSTHLRIQATRRVVDGVVGCDSGRSTRTDVEELRLRATLTAAPRLIAPAPPKAGNSRPAALATNDTSVGLVTPKGRKEDRQSSREQKPSILPWDEDREIPTRSPMATALAQAVAVRRKSASQAR